MRALKNFLKNYFLSIAENRNEHIEKTAIYLTWHFIVITSINAIAFIIGLFTSLEVFAWTVYLSLSLFTATFASLFTLTFQSTESFLRRLAKDCAFETAGIHTIYYLIGIVNALLILCAPRIFNETAQVNGVGQSMFILLCIYALCVFPAAISQCLRNLFIPYVNEKVTAAFKK